MAAEKENQNDRSLTVSRLLDAPLALVWEVWTKPEHISRWWGPTGFTNTTHEWDFKPGGHWRHTMHGPDGTDFPNENRFKEIVKHQRIVYEHLKPNFTATIEFNAEGMKTHIKWTMLFESKEEFEYVVKNFKADIGLVQNVDKLEQYLIGKNSSANEFSITRIFDAPRALVFKMFSEAEHLAKWWGPKGLTMNVVKLDFRPGGRFHYSMVTPDGHEMWGLFVYHDILAPELIIFVNSFSDMDGNLTRAPFNPSWPLQVKNTLTFTEDNGKTRLTLRGGPINASDEEIKIFSGSFDLMEQGFKGTLDQLEVYLAEVKN